MKPDKTKALFIARKVFVELVFDVQRMENMPFTLPEVQTYLQGVTVGGHKISDQEKLGQQILGWQTLIDLVEGGKFALTKETACALQAIIARDDALRLGAFRDGQVGIAGTDYAPPPASELDGLFDEMVASIQTIGNPCDRAYRLHLDMARNQFFYDGNKRTGLLMANGLLLGGGYPPLSIQAKRLAEYNAGMLAFYDGGDHADMLKFLGECHEGMYRRFAEQ